MLITNYLLINLTELYSNLFSTLRIGHLPAKVCLIYNPDSFGVRYQSLVPHQSRSIRQIEYLFEGPDCPKYRRPYTEKESWCFFSRNTRLTKKVNKSKQKRKMTLDFSAFWLSAWCYYKIQGEKLTDAEVTTVVDGKALILC